MLRSTFQQDVAEPAALLGALEELARSLLAEVRHRDFLIRTVGVMIRFADFETVRRQTTLARPTDDAATVEAALRGCFDRVTLATKVRLVGVRLAGLSHPRRRETHDFRVEEQIPAEAAVLAVSG